MKLTNVLLFLILLTLLVGRTALLDAFAAAFHVTSAMVLILFLLVPIWKFCEILSQAFKKISGVSRVRKLKLFMESPAGYDAFLLLVALTMFTLLAVGQIIEPTGIPPEVLGVCCGLIASTLIFLFALFLIHVRGFRALPLLFGKCRKLKQN